MISSPLILNTTGDVHTPPFKCLHQGRREHVSPNFSCIRETCLRLPQLFYHVSPNFSRTGETPSFLAQQKRQTQLPQLATRLTREEHP